MPDTLKKTRRVNRDAGGDGSRQNEPRRNLHAPLAVPFNKAEVAELPMDAIRRMTSDELQSVIRAADVPLFRNNVMAHLGYYDHSTLEQLAFLARRTVRNQGY